jgi:hypothetical protein
MRVRLPRFALFALRLAAAWFGVLPVSATPAWRPVLEGPESAPGGGDLSVTVTARAERSELGSGVAGFLALAVPLDRLAAPRKLAETVAEPPKRENAAETAADELTRPDADEPPAEPPEKPALSAALLARLASDAVRAALRTHGVSQRRSELEGLATRARFSAALPELRLRAVRSNDESQRLAPTLDDPERYTLTGGNDLLLEASATWKLNRLVFADEEIAVERLALEREKSTEKLSERVLERLFDWHRALSTLASADPKRRGRLELDRIEAEVELDVLTGGWFGETARRFSAPGYKPPVSTSSSRSSSSSTSTLPTPAQ